MTTSHSTEQLVSQTAEGLKKIARVELEGAVREAIGEFGDVRRAAMFLGGALVLGHLGFVLTATGWGVRHRQIVWTAGIGLFASGALLGLMAIVQAPRPILPKTRARLKRDATIAAEHLTT